MIDLVLDIIFPQTTCCVCREAGNYSSRHPWCPKCEGEMERLKKIMPICDHCGKYLEKGESLCVECRQNPPPFSIARAVGPYEDPFRIAVKVFKFLGRKHLARRMGDMMAEVIKGEERFWPLDIIVPVPISLGNLKQRGFNQTELLARRISRKIKVAMDSKILVRIKETPSQRELSREEREKNLLCAFQVAAPQKIKGKKILLVDDVYTTGSTIRECTRALLGAGAEKVSVITWATGKGF